MVAPMNYLVRSYLRKWDKELESITNRPDEIQAQELEKILRSRVFQYLNGVKPIGDFQKQALSNYDDYESRITRLMDSNEVSCRYFAQSSGTSSGKKKLIPTPDEFVKGNHLRGSWYLLHTMYKHNPEMSVFKSKNLLIGGSIYKKTSQYTIGDVSGIMLNRIPHYMRPWYVPTIAEAVMPDWERKIEVTARAAAKTSKVSLLGGAPTWVLSVIKNCLALNNVDSIPELWPHLQAYIHGGVNFEPYKSQFKELLDQAECRLIEVYNATEGFFAYQDRPEEEGMFLMCASGVYFEFIKWEDYKNENFNIINLSAVKLGEPYVMVITTMSGLMRYIQGDIIQFVTSQPYRVKVVGRVKAYINAFGEDLYKNEAEGALAKVLELHDASVKDYTIAPRYITLEHPGCHEWYVEFDQAPRDLRQFEWNLDQELQSRNSNYKQKRSGDISMTHLEIRSLPAGSIRSYLSSKGAINGQTKMPRLRNDRTIADALLQVMDSNILV